jgi:hypothetical protein
MQGAAEMSCCGRSCNAEMVANQRYRGVLGILPSALCSMDICTDLCRCSTHVSYVLSELTGCGVMPMKLSPSGKPLE